MISISDPQQCDDHCQLVFYGRLWWIIGKSGDVLLVTNSEEKIILDLSAVDWNDYLAAAVRSLSDHFPEARRHG